MSGVRVPGHCTVCGAITGSGARVPEGRAWTTAPGGTSRCGECGGRAVLAEGTVEVAPTGHDVVFTDGPEDALTVWRRYAAGWLRLRVLDGRRGRGDSAPRPS
jgi:hypothetical protein